MVLGQDASSRSENLNVSCGKKRLTHLVHCTESQIVLKTGQEKLYPPTERLAHCSIPTPFFGQV